MDTELEESQEDEPVQQAKSKVDYIRAYQWKKGQSGNPAGRQKGKTMKDYARELLEKMTEEERQEFLHGIPKEAIWEMAEGKAKSDDKLEVSLPKSLIEIIGGITNKKTDSGVSGEDKE